ncbi:MAG: J domain-containing protein [Pirellulales bacterium]
MRPVRPVVPLPGWTGSCPGCTGPVVEMPVDQLRRIGSSGWSEQELLRWLDDQERVDQAKASRERLAEEQQQRDRQRQREAQEASHRRREAADAEFRRAQEEVERRRRHEEAQRRQRAADEARQQEEQRRHNEERVRQQQQREEQKKRERQENSRRPRRAVMSADEARRVLEVAPNASQSEVQQAYRRLAKLYHPDAHIDPVAKEQASQQMVRVNQAYQVLRKGQLFHSVGARPPRNGRRRGKR